MEKHTRAERLSLFEILLPLMFYTAPEVFYIAVAIPCMAGLTLVVLEILRRVTPRTGQPAVYLLWLVLCGGTLWFAFKIPPYWIWSLHLLVPEALRVPPEIQKPRAFAFGFKKYSGRRIRELLLFLLAAAGAAGSIWFLRGYFKDARLCIVLVAVFFLADLFFRKPWKVRA